METVCSLLLRTTTVDWNALAAIGTLAAVLIALFNPVDAFRRWRITKLKREAISTGLYMELAEATHFAMRARDNARLSQHHPAAVLSQSGDVLDKIPVRAIEHAADHLEDFEHDTALLVHAYLGMLHTVRRQMRVFAEEAEFAQSGPEAQEARERGAKSLQNFVEIARELMERSWTASGMKTKLERPFRKD